ncbi:hypothetical protein ACWFPY_00815 [Nocardia fluminea]
MFRQLILFAPQTSPLSKVGNRGLRADPARSTAGEIERLVGGLIVRQDRGGLRVASVELNSIEDVVVVEHHGNSEFVQSRVGHRLILSKLRAAAVDDDSSSAITMYFDDVVAPITPGDLEPVDGVHLESTG